jgi:hypothetical protein
VTGEPREVSNAREAADALRRVTSRVKDDPEFGETSAEALDELLRPADRLGRTVEDVAGDESGDVRALAAAVAASPRTGTHGRSEGRPTVGRARSFWRQLR